MEFHGTINKGKVTFENKHQLTSWLQSIPEGEDLVVNFQVVKESKTLQQLKLAYHCFRVISDHSGYTIAEVKTLVKMSQGLCGYHNLEGRSISFCSSLSDFTRKQLSEFIVKMDEWAAANMDLKLLMYDDIQFLKSI